MSETVAFIEVLCMAYNVMKRKKRPKFSGGVLEAWKHALMHKKHYQLKVDGAHSFQHLSICHRT